MTSPTLHSVIKQVGNLSDEDLSIFFNATESTGDAYNFATPHVRKWFKTSFAEAVKELKAVSNRRNQMIFQSQDNSLNASPLISESRSP